jgi:TolB-like protein
MTEPSKAVFLSYASEDAAAAQHICETLHAGGIEVWFDKSALSGGDVWDASIRRQIRDCALFIPVISAHTQAREEGYFRLEWKLAVDRSHLMAESKPFLLPVVIDGTADANALVPERFREVQWTRLPGGQAPAHFAERVVRLLGDRELAEQHAVPARGTAGPAKAVPVPTRSRTGMVALGTGAVVLATALGVFLYLHGRAPAPTAATAVPSAATEPTAFSPPPHSVAVLPFVNLSGDPRQEYFSDGLSEEMLNSLVTIHELQVAARTSSFYFKGKDVDLAEVAHKLNVGAILEGSVRRDGNHVRITAQLINASTGFNLWSHTYDRDLVDVLKLQSEIADAVAGALKITLLGDIATRIELGGTHNPAAFDAYLRGAKALNSSVPSPALVQAAMASFSEAIDLDANYALALAGRSLAEIDNSENFVNGAAIPEGFEKALVDARRALAIAPDLPDGQMALAKIYAFGSIDFTQASEAWERAKSLAPDDARILREYGLFAVVMGRPDAGLAAIRRAVVLDPLGADSHFMLGQALFYAHHYLESVTAYNDAIALEPRTARTYGFRGLSYYQLGDFDRARLSCESKSEAWEGLWCLALVYDKLGRHADAEVALAKLTAFFGDPAAYQNAEIYAQWGNRMKSLEWLDMALHVRDPGVVLMITDPFVDQVRKEARFQAIVRALKFPD